MIGKIFRQHGRWALASDGLQWILYRRTWREIARPNQPESWKAVSFVRSTREILARCMREKGTEAPTAALLLEGLPDSFDQWKALETL